MNVTTRQQLFLTLNDGPALRVVETQIDGPEYDYVRSDTAVLPDPDWVVVDRNGHEHRWVLTGRRDIGKPEALPTLQRRRENVHCDGSCGNWDCDGWTNWAYNCRACGVLVEPGYRPDSEARARGIPFMRTPTRYRFQVEGDVLPPGTYRSDDPPFRAVLADSRAQRTGTAVFTGESEWGYGNLPLHWVEMRFDDDPDT